MLFRSGGFIVRDSGDNANFGVAGSCKNDFSWGHLEYVDHAEPLDHSYTPPLNVHWISITAYLGPGCSPTGPSDARCICGTATSNMGDVEFGVVVDDVGEPGVNDVFKIRLTKGGEIVYTTEKDSDHTLGGSRPGGGNIQLHKPDPSSTFGGSCPAFSPPACVPLDQPCDPNAPNNCCAPTSTFCNFQTRTCRGAG